MVFIVSAIKRFSRSKIAIFHTPSAMHSTSLLRGPRRNIAISFGANKLEQPGYQKVNNTEDLFSCFDTIHELTDSQADRQTPHDSISIIAR